MTKGEISVDDLVTAEGETRAAEIREILSEIKHWLSRPQTMGVVMAGDFNSGSHLDWIPSSKDLHNKLCGRVAGKQSHGRCRL